MVAQICLHVRRRPQHHPAERHQPPVLDSLAGDHVARHAHDIDISRRTVVVTRQLAAQMIVYATLAHHGAHDADRGARDRALGKYAAVVRSSEPAPQPYALGSKAVDPEFHSAPLPPLQARRIGDVVVGKDVDIYALLDGQPHPLALDEARRAPAHLGEVERRIGLGRELLQHVIRG